MRLTLILIALLTIAFIATAMQPVETQKHIINEFGFSSATFAEKPWTPITSIFLHADLMHILSNVFVLLFFGLAVEEEMGNKKYLAIFFLAAIAGSLLAGLFYPPETMAIGASGAIFGLVGAGMLVRPASLSAAPFVIPIPLAIIGILYIVYNGLGVLQDPTDQISYLAHFGGLYVGLSFGMYEKGLIKSLKTVTIGIIGAIAFIIIYIFVISPLLTSIF